MERLILKSFQSPGDIVTLSAAVRDLHKAYPGRFQTDVRTSADAIWENNPHLTPLREGDSGVRMLDMHYPAIHQSNQRPYHFLQGYAQYLEQQLELRIPITRFHGDIHLSASEKDAPPPGAEHGVPDRFWILVAGGKYDFTAKWWDPASFQSVVDHFRRRITFVQCGEEGHWHPRLAGVVDLVGKTSLRDFICLVYHADGVLCPVTLAMHLAAAVPCKPDGPRIRPCVVVAGGREPAHWEAYPNHQFLSSNGALPCCAQGGCWKSRCQLVGDGDPKDSRDLCESPVQISDKLRIPKCMDMITAADVIRRIELYYEGGALSFQSSGEREMTIAAKTALQAHLTPARPEIEPPDTEGEHKPRKAPCDTRVLIKFRHGLGDAVQLTVVLRHLRRLRPQWQIDVAALVGKHSAFYGLCDKVLILEKDPLDGPYDQQFDLSWDECAQCYSDSPSTKADRCLREVFGLEPDPELSSYVITPSDHAITKARRYLEHICRVLPSDNGRYPVVLLHYEGNTSAEYKNLSHDLAGQVCEEVIQGGSVPIILDWDNRSPLPDGKRIFNPHVDLELWGGIGTGDAEVLATLIELSQLMIGVDSGPLHVAGATSTPTIGVWTRHHPLHFFANADNVVHLVPETHQELLRGDRAAGLAYFEKHYRFEKYQNLNEALIQAVQRRLQDSEGGLVYTRNFWIRADNAKQDLVVVKDIAEDDSYGIQQLPMPRPVVVDVGAHIGCFSKRIHDRNPLARIIAVECCPENMPALRKNTSGFATVVQAALTYEDDVALLNAVFPQCVTTGGSRVVQRSELRALANDVAVAGSREDADGRQYWADARPLKTVTLEELMARQQLEHIDILKLDCEGSEFSILENAPSVELIGTIIGEYHGKERFHELVRRRFADWKLQILKDGELGTFWLTNPKSAAQTVPRRPQPGPHHARRPSTDLPRLLVTALRNEQGEPRYDLLLLDKARVVAKHQHDTGWLRGFARLNGNVWTVDSSGNLYQVKLRKDSIALDRISYCSSADEAHDLSVVGR